MSEIELSVSFPLDKQGFLRRACHVCGREFSGCLQKRMPHLLPPNSISVPTAEALHHMTSGLLWSSVRISTQRSLTR